MINDLDIILKNFNNPDETRNFKKGDLIECYTPTGIN